MTSPDSSPLLRNVQIYDRILYDRINAGEFEIMLPAAEELARILRKSDLLDGRGRRALDFSCGEGRNSEFLCRIGYAVDATEVTESAIAAARRRFEQNHVKAKATLVDVFQPEPRLPFADASFDLVVAWQCLQWVGARENFAFHLSEFARTMKPGAHMVLTMPTPRHRFRHDSIRCGEDQYRLEGQRRIGGTVYAPDLSVLEALLASARFRVVRKMGYSCWDDFDWTQERPHDDYNLLVQLAT